MFLSIRHRLLRHDARGQGLTVRSDGYVPCDQVLRFLAGKFRDVSMGKLRAAVAACPKQRFQLATTDAGVEYIRATQGHTLAGIDDDKLLTLITDVSTVPVAVHGTYMRHWDSILVRGERGVLALIFAAWEHHFADRLQLHPFPPWCRQQDSGRAPGTTFTSRLANPARATSSAARERMWTS